MSAAAATCEPRTARPRGRSIAARVSRVASVSGVARVSGVALASPRGLLVTALALALTAPLACDDPIDPLDRGELQRVARTQGDALGREHAGDYILAGTLESCDCPTSAELEGGALEGIDLCRTLAVSTSALAVAVYQEDGLLAMDLNAILALYGGVDLDGGFALAGLLDTSAFLVEGNLYSRVDGAFTDAHLSATITNRFVATSDLGEVVGLEDVDCRAVSILDGSRKP